MNRFTLAEPNVLVVLTQMVHVRNWAASGALDMLARRANLTITTHDPVLERDIGLLMKADSFRLAMCQEFAGRPIQRRMREGLRLGGLVAWEPWNRTCAHKLTQRRPLLPRLEIGLWRRLRRSGDLEAVARRLECLWPPRRAVTRFLDAVKPDVVLIPTLIHEDQLQADWFRAARRAGIPTVAAPASWDTLSSKGPFFVRPDSCLVWGGLSAHHAFHYHHGLANVVTGPVHWDGYPDWWLSPWPKGAEILVAGTTLNYWEDERETLALLGREGLRRGFHIWYRPHPRQPWGWNKGDEMPPGVSLDPAVVKMVAEGRRGWDYDLERLPRMFRRVRCVVAAFSTVVIEAALFGVPSVLVGFGRSRHGAGGVLRHADYEHMEEVTSWPGVLVARQRDEMLALVTQQTLGPAVDFSDALRRRAQDVALVDGMARERAVRAILAAAHRQFGYPAE